MNGSIEKNVDENKKAGKSGQDGGITRGGADIDKIGRSQ